MAILDLDFSHYLRCYLTKKQAYSPAHKLNNVIVSLTTTPPRIHKIWPTINSMMLQSVLPEKIYLWLPRFYQRFPEMVMKHIPEFILNNPLIQVKWIEKDFGPATKLLPCLQSPELQDKKIIVIDDDRLYPHHFIKNLIKYEQLEPSAAIGVAGSVVFGSRVRKYKSAKKLTKVDVLLGFNGYLVKPEFFSKTVFDYPASLPEAFFEDDVWLSDHLKKRGVRRFVIPGKSSIQSLMMPQKKSHGLCEHENKGQKNFLTCFNGLK